MLINYALERWLYRMTQSAHRDRFVLKGAMLFAIWSNEPHRSTKDLELLGYGSNSIAEMEEIFREICLVECNAVGLELPPATVRGSVIRENRRYEGASITLLAMLGKARIPLQIDVGFGDAVTPSPIYFERNFCIKFIYDRRVQCAEPTNFFRRVARYDAFIAAPLRFGLFLND
jgi:hypothetical protein